MPDAIVAAQELTPPVLTNKEVRATLSRFGAKDILRTGSQVDYGAHLGERVIMESHSYVGRFAKVEGNTRLLEGARVRDRRTIKSDRIVHPRRIKSSKGN